MNEALGVTNGNGVMGRGEVQAKSNTYLVSVPRRVKSAYLYCPSCGRDVFVSSKAYCCRRVAARANGYNKPEPEPPKKSFWERIAEQNAKKKQVGATS